MDGTQKEKPIMVLDEVLGRGLGKLNALVKTIMKQTGVDDPVEAIWLVNSGECIVVPRSSIGFDPAAFIAEGWLPSDDAQLPLAPLDIDLNKVEFVGASGEGMVELTGWERDERLRRLGRLHLGPDHFMHCWERRGNLPESWKKIGVISFDARKLRVHGHGRARFILILYYRNGAWGWNHVDLGDRWLFKEKTAGVAIE